MAGRTYVNKGYSTHTNIPSRRGGYDNEPDYHGNWYVVETTIIEGVRTPVVGQTNFSGSPSQTELLKKFVRAPNMLSEPKYMFDEHREGYEPNYGSDYENSSPHYYYGQDDLVDDFFNNVQIKASQPMKTGNFSTPNKYQPSNPNKYQPSSLNKYQPSIANSYRPSSPNKYRSSSPNKYQTSSPNKYQPSSPIDKYRPSSPNKYRSSSPNKYRSSSPNKYQTSSPNKYQPSSPIDKYRPSSPIDKYRPSSPNKYRPSSPNKYRPSSPIKYRTSSPDNYQPSSPNKHQTSSPNKYQPSSPDKHQTSSPNKYQPSSLNNHQTSSPNKYQPLSPIHNYTPKEAPLTRTANFSSPNKYHPSSPNSEGAQHVRTRNFSGPNNFWQSTGPPMTHHPLTTPTNDINEALSFLQETVNPPRLGPERRRGGFDDFPTHSQPIEPEIQYTRLAFGKATTEPRYKRSGSTIDSREAMIKYGGTLVPKTT